MEERAQRNARERASRACVFCQSRKIKCDVVRKGFPCGNCQLNKETCAVRESKRRKRFSLEKLLLRDNTLTAPGVTDEKVIENAALSVIDTFLENAPTSLDFELRDHVPAWQEPPQAADGQAKDDTRIHQKHVSYLTPSSNDGTVLSPVNCHILDHGRGRLADFFYPVPAAVDQVDIEHLMNTGTLSTPSLVLQHELLKAYVQYIHPFLPLLDVGDFLIAIASNNRSTKISLLLFQCVMFAATSFVDEHFLKAEGFENRKSARKIFYRRVKALYDAEYESDRVTLIQALLLMTYWYETPFDRKDPWYWIGICLSFAYSIGLHQTSVLLQTPADRRPLLKRLWWCCITRERLISISMRKPLRTKITEHDISMLDVNDFEHYETTYSTLEILGDSIAPALTKNRTLLSELCIEHMRLSVILERILNTQYVPLPVRFGGKDESVMLLSPALEVSPQQAASVFHIQMDVEQWRQNLPSSCSYETLDQIDMQDDPVVSVIHFHKAVLMTMHFTIRNALHRPQLHLKLPQNSIYHPLQQQARIVVKEAAIQVTTILRDLLHHDLVRFLPPSGVTMVTPAMIFHLQRLRSSAAEINSDVSEGFLTCNRVLQQLRDIYFSADAAFVFLNHFPRAPLVLPDADLRLPSQTMLAGDLPEIEVQPCYNETLSKKLATVSPEAPQSTSISITANDVLHSTTASANPLSSVDPFVNDTNLGIWQDFLGDGIDSSIDWMLDLPTSQEEVGLLELT